MLDDKALFDANDASIRAGPWITGAAGPQPRDRMAGWSPPKSLTPPTLRGEPAAGAPACTAALTLGHLLREITQLAHFRLRPLSSLSDAESELLRDNDPGGLNLTTLVLEEAPQVSGRLVQKDPLGGGLGSWGWSKTPTNRQTVPFKLGKICPVRA
jgi:hypothetical protein